MLYIYIYIRRENEITFYGSSFISDNTGKKVQEADETSKTLISHSFNLNELQLERASWGLFRDRRPELYSPLLSLDGRDLSPSRTSSLAVSECYMPAEWENHDKCWMLWIPDDTEVWSKCMHYSKLLLLF